ncbi:MAG: sugar phosphate isomerase/epimerase [Clostridia bacterium]|nr:sugar phosphate isomerase/epimerase [Clostridia bacterium]
MSNAAWMTNIKFSISTADAAPDTAPLLLLGGICENLKKAHEAGYSAIEVHTRENVDLDYEKILDVCNELDMRISAVVTGRLNTQEHVSLIDDDSIKANKAVDGLKKYIDIAEILKSDIIIGWIKGVLPDRDKSTFYEKRLAHNLRILAVYASKKHVKLFIEGVNRYETNYLSKGKEIIDFIEKYDIPNVFIHLDTFHMNIEEENISDTIRYCGSKLGYIHFADSNREYPGSGHIDFKSIIKALDDIHYDGYIAVECLPIPTGEEAARFAIENIKAVFESI